MTHSGDISRTYGTMTPGFVKEMSLVSLTLRHLIDMQITGVLETTEIRKVVSKK